MAKEGDIIDYLFTSFIQLIGWIFKQLFKLAWWIISGIFKLLFQLIKGIFSGRKENTHMIDESGDTDQHGCQ